MDNKSTTAKDAAGKTAQISGSKKGNGSGALTIENAVGKTKRSPAKNLVSKSAPALPESSGSSTGFTQDDIALRAYFLSEKRREHGLAGDQHQDWLEAERQLREEGRAISGAKARRPRR